MRGMTFVEIAEIIYVVVALIGMLLLGVLVFTG